MCGLAGTDSRPSTSKCLASVLNQDHPPAAVRAFDRSVKMFEQTLQDLIKGIRNPKNDQVVFVAKAIQEIKDEIKSRDVAIKAQAIQKLTYVSRPNRGCGPSAQFDATRATPRSRSSTCSAMT